MRAGGKEKARACDQRGRVLDEELGAHERRSPGPAVGLKGTGPHSLPQIWVSLPHTRGEVLRRDRSARGIALFRSAPSSTKLNFSLERTPCLAWGGNRTKAVNSLAKPVRMCLRLWEKVLTGLTDPLNMIHTKIAHAGIRVNVGRARTMGKRKATRVGCWGWGLSLHFFTYFFFILNTAPRAPRSSSDHQFGVWFFNCAPTPPAAPPRPRGPRPQPPPRASPSSDQRQRDNTQTTRPWMAHPCIMQWQWATSSLGGDGFVF
eukprot:scaffold5115_cov113-Isochrysis_galbana.AAC.4